MSETERQTKKAKVEIGNVENNLKVEKNIKIETKIKVENNDGFDEKESTEKNESNEKKEVMEQDEKKAESKPQAKSSEDGGTYFELSEYRRLAVRKFKGTVMVDIREFYEKNGKKLPGKKGISLPLSQYQAIRHLIIGGQIDKEIAKLG